MPPLRATVSSSFVLPHLIDVPSPIAPPRIELSAAPSTPTDRPSRVAPHSAGDVVEGRDERRFGAVDGLRGIAALAVVVYHLSGAVSLGASHWVPPSLQSVFERGFLGVDVFFVISGFVIAYSVRAGSYTGGYLARFALRRSIRLDPPYWCTIALELCLIWLGLALFPSLGTPVPSGAQVVSHLFYAQNLLGYGDIVDSFWTLCYEIQFYLFFISILIAWQSLRPHASERVRRLLPALSLSALFVASLSLRYTSLELPVPGVALERWYQFFLGVLVWWTVSTRTSLRVLVGAWLVHTGFVIVTQTSPVQHLAVLVSGLIFATTRVRRIDSLLGARPLLTLGRLSYSLYLFHGPIGWRFVSLSRRVLGDDMSTPVAWLVFLAALGVCLLASSIAWRVLEGPFIKLSKRVRLPIRPVTATARPGSPSYERQAGLGSPQPGLPVSTLVG